MGVTSKVYDLDRIKLIVTLKVYGMILIVSNS